MNHARVSRVEEVNGSHQLVLPLLHFHGPALNIALRMSSSKSGWTWERKREIEQQNGMGEYR